MLVNMGGVVFNESGIIWFRPYKNQILLECIQATYIEKFPKKGKWIFYVDISSGDSINLFLFENINTYKLWEQLRNIKNLGTRRAANILAAYPAEELLRIIAYGQEDMLASIKGIGKKTARRIIVELMEELSTGVEELEEVKKILISWGYKKREVNLAVSRLYNKGIDVENLKFDTLLRELIKVIDGGRNSYT